MAKVSVYLVLRQARKCHLYGWRKLRLGGLPSTWRILVFSVLSSLHFGSMSATDMKVGTTDL